MRTRVVTVGLAIIAWVALGLLIGYQSSQESAPTVWALVQRFALAGFAFVATFIASKHTARA